MQFTHDFREDLEQLDFFAKEPWALVRFADGERAILNDENIWTADGWTPSFAHDSLFGKCLERSLTLSPDRYFIGLPCECCDSHGQLEYLADLNCPEDDPRITFSNIFANANYDRFRQRAMDEHFGARCAIVGSGGPCHYDIPSNLVNHPQAMEIIDDLVKRLYDETKTILVAAGPAANVIIHRYWTSCPPEKRRVIVDIGSALDPWLHGRMTRGYHTPEHPNRKKVCVWTTNKS